MSEHMLVDLVTEQNFQPQVLKRYRALILPSVKYMSDRDVALAAQLASERKTLLVGEGSAAYDDKMRERNPSPLAAHVSDMESKAILSRLATMSPPPVRVLEKKSATEFVRLAAYADDPAAPGRIVLHLVNYAVPLGVNAAPVQEIRDVKVNLPLPQGRHAASLVMAVPGEADRTLPVRTESGRAIFVIPSLRIYGVCKILLEK
jgi:hypothetical protein